MLVMIFGVTDLELAWDDSDGSGHDVVQAHDPSLARVVQVYAYRGWIVLQNCCKELRALTHCPRRVNEEGKIRDNGTSVESFESDFEILHSWFKFVYIIDCLLFQSRDFVFSTFQKPQIMSYCFTGKKYFQIHMFITMTKFQAPTFNMMCSAFFEQTGIFEKCYYNSSRLLVHYSTYVWTASSPQMNRVMATVWKSNWLKQIQIEIESPPCWVGGNQLWHQNTREACTTFNILFNSVIFLYCFEKYLSDNCTGIIPLTINNPFHSINNP